MRPIGIAAAAPRSWATINAGMRWGDPGEAYSRMKARDCDCRIREGCRCREPVRSPNPRGYHPGRISRSAMTQDDEQQPEGLPQIPRSTERHPSGHEASWIINQRTTPRALGIGRMWNSLCTPYGDVAFEIDSPEDGENIVVWGNFFTLLMFAAFVSLAVVFRKRPEAHKRLMLLASMSIVGPALARLPRWPIFAGGFEAGRNCAIAGVLTMFALLLTYDVVTRKKPHPASWIGMVLILASLAGAVFLGITGIGYHIPPQVESRGFYWEGCLGGPCLKVEIGPHHEPPRRTSRQRTAATVGFGSKPVLQANPSAGGQFETFHCAMGRLQSRHSTRKAPLPGCL